MTVVNPLLSICIPTFNRPSYLRECLDSIYLSACNANMKDATIEVIVSDNGDEKETLAVLVDYRDKLRIKYNCNEDNIGPARNLLKSASLACGIYLWFFSDDDLMHEGALLYLAQFICRYPKVEYLYYARLGIDETSLCSGQNIEPQGCLDGVIYNSGKELFDSVGDSFQGHIGFFSSTILKRDLWERALSVYSRAPSEFMYLEILFQSIIGCECTILNKLGVFYRKGNSTGFYVHSRVWIDDYILAFMYAKRLGYNQEYCDSAIISISNAGQKHFFIDKVLGRRKGSLFEALGRLDVNQSQVRKSVWYWLSYMPDSYAKLLRPVYNLMKSRSR